MTYTQINLYGCSDIIKLNEIFHKEHGKDHGFGYGIFHKGGGIDDFYRTKIEDNAVEDFISTIKTIMIQNGITWEKISYKHNVP